MDKKTSEYKVELITLEGVGRVCPGRQYGKLHWCGVLVIVTFVIVKVSLLF